MGDIIEILRKRNIIEILLELRTINGPIDKNTLNFRIIGDRQPRQSIYDGCNDLENINLIDVDKESKPNKHFVTLSKEGKELARKLSYVFDSEIEVFPVPKKQVEKLTKILEDQQEGSIENFILNCVMEKIKKHKVFK